ncbi:UDP-N-acetylglucosamine transporter [Galendromus occidentalis]|uniref:UDP-N-acetylglucosamine transporter n=1 Tax=Galendromus occidentalis TaxID=34638 RepID=A0AAJ6VZD2_9ACAR|nr:UDP-N-acetylglucosamine transporter [Galendromus occidentalis]
MEKDKVPLVPSLPRANSRPSQRVILKYFSLLVIVIQTTIMVLLLRYSKTQKVTGGRYLSSTAIVVSEIFKLLVCFAVLASRADGLKKTLRIEVYGKPLETSKLLIPAGLYTIQNNLLFLALGRLDAATYQVTYQLKILTTALFSVLMLKRRLSIQQWVSLILLMSGVALVQLPPDYQFSYSGASKMSLNHLVGLAAVLLASLSSGFAGVFYERLLKHSTQELWVRNTQLALFGILLGAAAVVLVDLEKVMDDGFFQGYNAITWAVVFLQTFGGLAVSYATKYADAILKGFATSISIVLSTAASWWILEDFEPSVNFFVGTAIVMMATVSFGMPVKK